MLADPLLILDGVRVWTAEGASLLRDVSWTVRSGEHWALLGPNGAGKSTLLSLAGASRHPSAGTVRVLGGQIGRTNVWTLRERLGVVDPTLRMPEWLSVEEIVLTGASGTVQPLWDHYGDAENARAVWLLDLLGCADLAGREIGTCSQGERQRVRIARALMPAPALLLLDEPAAGLDLAGREALLAALERLAATEPALATVLVVHHLEELPTSTTHALLLRQGAAVAAGPVPETLTSEEVSACFGVDVQVRQDDGRWTARANASWRARH